MVCRVLVFQTSGEGISYLPGREKTFPGVIFIKLELPGVHQRQLIEVIVGHFYIFLVRIELSVCFYLLSGLKYVSGIKPLWTRSPDTPSKIES